MDRSKRLTPTPKQKAHTMDFLSIFLPILGVVLGVAGAISMARDNPQAALWAGVSAMWAVNALIGRMD